MANYPLITLIFYILIFLIIWKITKKIIKTILYLFLFTLIISVFFTILIYNDFNNIKNNLTKSSLLIIQENDNLLSIVKINLTNNSQYEELPKDEFISIKNLFNQKNYDLILNKNYFKLIIFNLNLLNISNKTEIILDNIKFEKNQIIRSIKSDNPKKILNIEQTRIGDNSLKTILFIKLITDKDTTETLFLYENLKNNNINIYKETIIFKFIKILPKELITAIKEKYLNKVLT